MKHAAFITIFIHQPVTEADSLFISDFTSVRGSRVSREQTPGFTIMSAQTPATISEQPVGSTAGESPVLKGLMQL